MVADDMSISTTRASDKDRARVIPLLRDIMVAAMTAWHTSKRQLVVCRIDLWALSFACGRLAGFVCLRFGFGVQVYWFLGWAGNRVCCSDDDGGEGLCRAEGRLLQGDCAEPLRAQLPQSE